MEFWATIRRPRPATNKHIRTTFTRLPTRSDSTWPPGRTAFCFSAPVRPGRCGDNSRYEPHSLPVALFPASMCSYCPFCVLSMPIVQFLNLPRGIDMARIIGRLPSGRNRRIYGQHYMKDLPDQEPMFGSTRRTVAKKTAKKSAGQPEKMAHGHISSAGPQKSGPSPQAHLLYLALLLKSSIYIIVSGLTRPGGFCYHKDRKDNNSTFRAFLNSANYPISILSLICSPYLDCKPRLNSVLSGLTPPLPRKHPAV